MTSSSSSISSILNLHGLPPLPRSLNGYIQQQQLQLQQQQQQLNYKCDLYNNTKNNYIRIPSNIIPPSLPSRSNSSRRSSSSNSSSFSITTARASPDHNRSNIIDSHHHHNIRNSPIRSLSSSPHSPHNYLDSGLGGGGISGRSSNDSIETTKSSFVRFIKSPLLGSVSSVGGGYTRLDGQLIQLKKDMNHLRQQDMALLGHLLQIHQGIQDLKNHLIIPHQHQQLQMFHTSYPIQCSSSSSSSRKHSYLQQQHHSSSPSSKLNQLINNNKKIFSSSSSSTRRTLSSDQKMMDNIIIGVDDDTDSLSSLEFGDV